MTNTVSRYAASNALATTPRLDVNLITVTLIICTTIVALAWILTRHRPSNDDTDKVLCFLSLGKSKSSHVAERINRGLSSMFGGITVIGAFPVTVNGVNNVKLVSSCGGPIPYRDILNVELAKVDLHRCKGLNKLRCVLAYGISNCLIQPASEEDLCRFKNVQQPQCSWSEMSSFEDDSQPIFFTIDGLNDRVLIMCIQHPNCAAHRNATNELL